ncbi:kptA [Symbiodinium sp. CCMP2592]|nr:kptA [Symbiodinium sp. CCMP2592]
MDLVPFTAATGNNGDGGIGGRQEQEANQYFLQLLQENNQVNVFLNDPRIQSALELRAEQRHRFALDNVYAEANAYIAHLEATADANHRQQLAFVSQSTHRLVGQLHNEVRVLETIARAERQSANELQAQLARTQRESHDERSMAMQFDAHRSELEAAARTLTAENRQHERRCAELRASVEENHSELIAFLGSEFEEKLQWEENECHHRLTSEVQQYDSLVDDLQDRNAELLAEVDSLRTNPATLSSVGSAHEVTSGGKGGKGGDKKDTSKIPCIFYPKGDKPDKKRSPSGKRRRPSKKRTKSEEKTAACCLPLAATLTGEPSLSAGKSYAVAARKGHAVKTKAKKVQFLRPEIIDIPLEGEGWKFVTEKRKYDFRYKTTDKCPPSDPEDTEEALQNARPLMACLAAKSSESTNMNLKVQLARRKIPSKGWTVINGSPAAKVAHFPKTFRTPDDVWSLLEDSVNIDELDGIYGEAQADSDVEPYTTPKKDEQLSEDLDEMFPELFGPDRDKDPPPKDAKEATCKGESKSDSRAALLDDVPYSVKQKLKSSAAVAAHEPPYGYVWSGECLVKKNNRNRPNAIDHTVWKSMSKRQRATAIAEHEKKLHEENEALYREAVKVDWWDGETYFDLAGREQSDFELAVVEVDNKVSVAAAPDAAKTVEDFAKQSFDSNDYSFKTFEMAAIVVSDEFCRVNTSEADRTGVTKAMKTILQSAALNNDIISLGADHEYQLLESPYSCVSTQCAAGVSLTHADATCVALRQMADLSDEGLAKLKPTARLSPKAKRAIIVVSDSSTALCKKNRRGVFVKTDLDAEVNIASMMLGWAQTRYTMCWGKTLAWIVWQVEEHIKELRANYPDHTIDVICWWCGNEISGQSGCIPTRLGPGLAYRDPNVTTETVARKVRRAADVLAALLPRTAGQFGHAVAYSAKDCTALFLMHRTACRTKVIQLFFLDDFVEDANIALRSKDASPEHRLRYGHQASLSNADTGRALIVLPLFVRVSVGAAPHTRSNSFRSCFCSNDYKVRRRWALQKKQHEASAPASPIEPFEDGTAPLYSTAEDFEAHLATLADDSASHCIDLIGEPSLAQPSITQIFSRQRKLQAQAKKSPGQAQSRQLANRGGFDSGASILTGLAQERHRLPAGA